DVDVRVRVGVGTGGVVHAQRRVGLVLAVVQQRVGQRDLAGRYAQVAEVGLAGPGERGARDAARKIVGVDAGCGLGHAASRIAVPAWSAAPWAAGRVLFPTRG